MFGALNKLISNSLKPCATNFLQSLSPVCVQPTRPITQMSLWTGKRRTCNAVIKRFKRLDWGGWIHTRPGRYKKVWKKHSLGEVEHLRQHIFVSLRYSVK